MPTPKPPPAKATLARETVIRVHAEGAYEPTAPPRPQPPQPPPLSVEWLRLIDKHQQIVGLAPDRAPLVLQAIEIIVDRVIDEEQRRQLREES